MSEVLGVDQANAKLERLLAAGSLGKEAYTEIGNIILSEFQENFRVGGRPTAWKQSIRVRVFGGQTLLDKGRLLRSFTVQPSDDGVAIGSNHPGARIHALGGIIKAKNAEFLTFRVPARLRKTSRTGKELKTPKKEYALVRVKQVEMPQRDYRYVSPQGWSYVTMAAVRHLKTAMQ